MKVKCNRAALYEAVQLAASIVPARSPKPILQCARMEADRDNQTLTITATDNEITIKYVIPQVEVEMAGVAVLPAERITAILRESTDSTISMAMDEATCQLSGMASQFHIYGHDPDDFPVMSTESQQPSFTVNAGVLKRMISMVIFSAARESTQYAINGVLWEHSGKKLKLIATDGRRLALVDGEVTPAEKDMQQEAIVPIKAMLLAERLLHDQEDKVGIAFVGNHLFVHTAQAEISGNLVQGRFPKYSDVIPSGCDKKVQIDVEPFSSALRQVALLVSELSKGVKLAFSNGQLRLLSSAPETGDAEIEMAIKYEGDSFDIGFNPQYLLEMLRAIDLPEIVFELIDADKPGIVRAGSDFLYVLMPVKV